MRDGFIKVAAATPKIRVADCDYNATQIIDLMKEAAALGVKVMAFPELCLAGYTCGDLFLQDALLVDCQNALGRVLAETAELDLLAAIGLPMWHNNKLYNCAAVIHRGDVLGLVPKTHIPNYGEFYEERWFASFTKASLEQKLLFGKWENLCANEVWTCETVPNLTIGVEICEDLWAVEPPSGRLAAAGATIILNLSASDEVVGKAAYRRQLVKSQSARLGCAYVYADAGEGESTSDLVFAGHNIIAENGTILAENRYHTGLTVTEIDVDKLAYERRRVTTFPTGKGEDVWRAHVRDMNVEDAVLTRPIAKSPFVPQGDADRAARCEDILNIAALGLKKRLEHIGAPRPVLGLSGGLDSTLAALITARALDMLGRPRTDLLCVTMPCFGTTQRTRSNAEVLAQRLGAELRTVDITQAVKQHFADIGQSMDDHDVTYENAQARERTQVLMDLANQCGGLVIGTGDLSELALGWCTYNGDQMSMYAVNASIPKTLVRHVVAYAADVSGDPALSAALRDILATPVSPELLPAENGEISQKTEDIVGPYELHDFFLYYIVRWAFPPRKVLRLAEYAFQGDYDRATILKWLKTFYKRFFSQQFKRQASPDGPKVGTVDLNPRGSWRMPSDASAKLWLEELENL